jgi:hypothetical protein
LHRHSRIGFRFSGEVAVRQHLLARNPAKFHGLFDGRSLTACASFIGPGRSYSALKAALEKGGFRRTKAYRLINLGKIEAYQMEGQTMVDADSIDRYH